MARAVKQGMESGVRAEDLAATVTKIDAMDYRSIVAEPETEGDTGELKAVAEGALLPSTKIHTSANLVRLQKHGRMLVSTYEALRFQKLDLLTVTLRQIGAYIAGAQVKDAVDVLMNGEDGNTPLSYTKGTPDYGDFIGLWGALAPYELNTVVAGTAAMQKLLQVAEFKDAQAGMNFQGTGTLCTPLGARLVHVPGMAADKIVVLDKGCALEMVQSGGITMDCDKLIDRQLERAGISVISGFSRIFKDAAAGLDCGA